MAASSVTEKRRKVTGSTTTTKGELVKLSTSYVELRSRKRVVIASENLVIPATAESNIGVRTEAEEVEERCASPSSSDRDVQASCCSSNGSSEIADGDNDDQKRIGFVDLEDVDDGDGESAEVETSTYNSCRERRREMTPSSKLREESDDVESAAARQTVEDSHRRSVVAEKMPSELELEEFFAAAEKDIQKRFAEKYNYDIVKDTPLEGRYEWVRIKP
ncbi:hypothetical protein TIFTF001_002682 [Ficus carica]|uniref:Cyclin-dependent kinase inhibitor n=1 Tax=Ficus carica TaxID=3494 RepID=A0AA87ZCM2_FICCA|nr:hypothetical protein TIFTF001_002682 [Ficus carica]